MEQERLEREIEKYKDRKFACLEDAEREIALIHEKGILKAGFHNTTVETEPLKKKKQGRPFIEPTKNTVKTEYQLRFSYQQDDDKIKEYIRQESTFVLISNDLALSAKDILLEYNTQSSVEKRFQQLKSSHFVNTFYLDKPERVEALAGMLRLYPTTV